MQHGCGLAHELGGASKEDLLNLAQLHPLPPHLHLRVHPASELEPGRRAENDVARPEAPPVHPQVPEA